MPLLQPLYFEEKAMKKIINHAKYTDTLGNIVYTPESNEADFSELPLLVYLHGAGERGNNLEHLSRHAIPRLIDGGANYPAIVLCPQCPADVVWDNIPSKIKKTIDVTVSQCGIKPDRILLTGSSMGGFGSIMLGMTYRSFFAGIAAVAGGGMSWRAGNLSKTPVLLCHGDHDSVVPAKYSLMLYERLKQTGCDAELRILEGFDHNDGINKAYEDPYLINWLLAKTRQNFDYVPECLESIF